MTRERPSEWEIESMHYHGLNVISCDPITGHTCTPLVGAYLPPSALDQLPDLEDHLRRFRDPIFLGDLDMDIDKARSPRSQQVADLLVVYVIIDLVRHFCQCRRFRNLKN